MYFLVCIYFVLSCYFLVVCNNYYFVKRSFLKLSESDMMSQMVPEKMTE